MNQTRFLEILKKQQQVGLVGPLYEENSSELPPQLPLILVDGGADHFAKDSTNPILKIGDGDSSQSQMDVNLNPKKDFSDLSFALKLLPQNIHQVYLEGFLGGRRDHEYINLGELHHFLLEREGSCQCFLGNRVLGYSAGTHIIDIEGSFSLICLEKTLVKYLEGDCSYQINTPTEINPLSSHGLSNWSNGKVKIESERPFFIFLNPDLKE